MKKPSKELLAKWDKKLAKAGFVDAEQRDTEMLHKHHDYYWRRRFTAETFAARQRYFELADQHHQEGFFDTGSDKRIWRMHADGLSLSEIAKATGKSRTVIFETVKKIKIQAGLRYAETKTGKGK